MRNMVLLVHVYESHLNTDNYLEILDHLRNKLNGFTRKSETKLFYKMVLQTITTESLLPILITILIPVLQQTAQSDAL